MTLLQIEHPIPDYNAWKLAFDKDPLNRKEAGVRRYATFHPTGDFKYIIIHLEFDTLKDALALLERLKELCGSVEGKIMMNPRTRILEMLDCISY